MADSKEPQELRDAYEKMEKDLKAAQGEITNLRSENRTLKAETVFGKVGLVSNQAKLYPADAELTEQAVKAWADEYGLKVPAPTSEAPQGPGAQESVPSVGSPSLGLVGRAGSGAGTGGQPPAGEQMLTSAEWAELHRKDPLAAEKARQEGRVTLRAGNPYLRTARS